jgi:hypothetical protein
MYRRKIWSTLVLALAANSAAGACAPIRIGYIDQDRPPYWLGSGTAIPNPPGASVELVKAVAASVSCPVAMLRMPILRILPALEAGTLDFAPMDALDENAATVAFPLDRNGQKDSSRAVRLVTVAFVRASDKLARDTDPMQYFTKRTVGTTHGANFVPLLRQAGIGVDEGAVDAAANFDKLLLRRIDGFALTLIEPGDMDAYVATRYQGKVVRLDKALRSSYIWLAANRAYYDMHRERVEAMWAWLGGRGRTCFTELIKKYAHEP